MPLLALLTSATSWWEGLNLAQQLFYGIGLLAGSVALVLVIMAMIGMDHDEALDALSSGDTTDSGGIFSVKPLTGFFLGFGWAGGMAMDQGASVGLAILAAIASGAIMMGIIIAMFRAILSLKSDGTVMIQNALGALGTVYVTIPPAKAAGGQAIISIQGRQETYEAVADSTSPLPAGTRIKVTAVVGPRTLLVEAL
jgi:membrane protein implicated in regulation of membrane protease activity